MQIIEKDLKELKPYENNPRNNDEAVKYVAESIKQFGFKVPIVIDKENVIVAGHTRYKAAKKLKIKAVPCIIADDLTPEQIKAFRLADNKVAEKATWNFDLLNLEMGEILNIDLEALGFETLDLEPEEEKEPEEDNYNEEPPEEPKSKRGQIYRLGRHRIMCGDSTDPADVERLIRGEKMDLCVTDPPYNVDYAEKEKDLEKWRPCKRVKEDVRTGIENDKMTDASFREFLNKAFSNLYGTLKPGGVFYVFHAATQTPAFWEELEDAGLRIRQQLTWVKNVFVIGRSDYHWKHEPCLYGWKDGAAHYFIDDRTQSTVFEDAPADPKKMKKEELINLVLQMQADKTATTVIHEDKPAINDLHPTMKPVKLVGKLIKNSSKEGEKVIDLFGGSGSTLIACEQLNRTAYLMEYEPKYLDVIIDRYERLTGDKAELIEE